MSPPLNVYLGGLRAEVMRHDDIAAAADVFAKSVPIAADIAGKEFLGRARVGDYMHETARMRGIIEAKGEDWITAQLEPLGKVKARLDGEARPVTVLDDIGIPFTTNDAEAASPERAGRGATPSDDGAPIVPAVFIARAEWPQEAPPPVDWLAKGTIPCGEVTLFAGDGGSGKTDSALQLAANVARVAPDWFGHEIASGPVVFISAEESEAEIERRLYWLGKRDGYGNADASNLHKWFPDKTGDTVLATPDFRSGIMRPSQLMLSIVAAIGVVKPVLVVVDNVAATFAGNQNDRVAARTYVNLWRTIARGPSQPAVLLLDHPSLSGLTLGTGRGGNMDWWNAVRSVLLLRTPDDKAEADQGIRLLETGKSNYAKRGNPLRLQWADGGLRLEHAPTSLHRLAKDQKCEEIFMRLLDERNAQGRYVSDKGGKNYAPAAFADMTDAGGYTAKAFAAAMNRLFEARKIALREQRIDGKGRNVIDRASTTSSAAA